MPLVRTTRVPDIGTSASRMGATWALFLGLVLALLGGHGADASLAALSCGDNCEPGPDLLP